MIETDDLDDLLSEESVNNPASYFRKLREKGPVYWNRRWNGWVVTGYEEVTSSYRDAARLSSDRFSGPFGAEVREAGDSRLLDFLQQLFVWKDPPYHTRMRGLVFKAFTPRSVEIMRQRIQSLVRELAEPVRGKERVDFLSEFAFHLPVIVIAEYLGVPSDQRYEVREWSDDLAAVIFVRGNDKERMGRAEASLARAREFLKPVIADRRQNPQNDLISGLLFAENEEGERLTEDEVIANVILMVFAGHETTMNLLTNGIIAFDKFPDQWQLLRKDHGLLRSATEECLRFDGPIRGLGRWATEDFEIGGQQIKRMDRLFLMQHSANRDPAAFENADSLDITRWPNKHAAFGQGIHTCLGAPLARLEMHEALAYLTTQFDRIEVVQDKIEYVPNMVSRAPKHVDVKFHDA